MRRLRRFTPGLIGMCLAGVILWRTGETIEREAAGQERFSIVVAEPVAVVDVPDRPGTVAPPIWQARMRPLAQLERVEISLDGRPIEAERATETGMITVPLADTSAAPGWHFVELEIDRRGGRSERVVDPVLVGRFEPSAKPCAASFLASPMLVRSVIVPMLEREVLPPLRENEYMGPTTELRDVSLQLGEGRVHFDIEIAGINNLFVSGMITVELIDGQQLHAELVELGDVEFRGELRDRARDLGAGGGALVGGLIAGPLAPVGAAAGWYVADKYVSKKARDVVREQIDNGLQQLHGVELLPEHVELIPGQPDSAVRIGFCVQTGVRALGLLAGVWIEPIHSGTGPKYPLRVPGPIDTGTIPTIDPLGPHEDLRVELSIDAVNLLLTHWTQTGLLAELIGQESALEHANDELAAWTPLRLRSLTPSYPPTLTPAGGPAAGWAYGLGGLTVEVDGVDDEPWGQIFVAAAGTMQPVWDREAGELSLIGSLDRLDITCATPDSDESLALAPCFSEVLEAADVRSRIDAHLRPGARGLPSLALRELFDDALTLSLDDLSLSRPRPGLLRMSAAVRPGTVR